MSSRKCGKQLKISYLNEQSVPLMKTKRSQKKWRQKTKNSTSYDHPGKQKSIHLHILKFTKNGKLNRKVGWLCVFTIVSLHSFCLAAWSKVGWLSYQILFEGVPPHLVCKKFHIYETLCKDIWQSYQICIGKPNR